MIHAYHVIFGAYGFWLPNDPRGSWSDFVGNWELVRFGKATKSLARQGLSPEQESERLAAKRALRYPPVLWSGTQARAIGTGFAIACRKSALTVWASSILPEHLHAVVGRHRFKVEYIVGLLKGEATKQLNREQLHPLATYRSSNGLPTPWAERCWKAFLDSEEAVENAIRYVNENPVKEGKPMQKWSFVMPFCGIPKGGWTTYH